MYHKREDAIMFCSNCGKEISDKAYICPNCGVKTNASADAENDQLRSMSIAAIVLTFFVPIVGFILGIVVLAKMKQNGTIGVPSDVRDMSISAVAIVGFGILLTIILMLALFC